MKFRELLHIVGDEPVFETGLLLIGDVDPQEVRVQLARWTRAGKLIQLRRGLYSLAPPYQKIQPHPYLVANRLVIPSYVSLESALAFQGMIPEYVPLTTSVTSTRPQEFSTSLGSFDFRHIRKSLFFGYAKIDLPEGQSAFVATPEKALLDLVYLRAAVNLQGYLQELRLQNMDQLNMVQMLQMAERSNKPKLHRAAQIIRELAKSETLESVVL